MMRWRAIGLFTAVGLGLSAGCNAILGNEEGIPRPLGLGEAGAIDAAAADGEGTADAKEVADATFDAALTCSPDKKACASFRACVTPTDPNFGCGDPGCNACDTTNAQSVTCAGVNGQSVCKATCNAGFANCDNKPENGCESDFSKSATCGSCTNACPVGQFCANTAGVYTCVGACPPGQETCGTKECVDKNTSAQNCGSCGNDCSTSVPPNSTATCSGGVCGFKCEALYHQCGTTCVADSSADACGPACIDCVKQAPPNMIASCQTNACQFQCASGWGDCNGDPSDGCETFLLNDNFHCGSCKVACGGGGPILQVQSYVPPTSTTYCCNGTCISSDLKCLQQPQ